MGKRKDLGAFQSGQRSGKIYFFNLLRTEKQIQRTNHAQNYKGSPLAMARER